MSENLEKTQRTIFHRRGLEKARGRTAPGLVVSAAWCHRGQYCGTEPRTGQGPGASVPRQPQRAKNTLSSLVRVSSDSGLWLTVNTHQQEQLGSRQAEGHGRAVVARAKWPRAGHFWSCWPACARCVPERALMAAPVPPETTADLEWRTSRTWKGSPPWQVFTGPDAGGALHRRPTGEWGPPGRWPVVLTGAGGPAPPPQSSEPQLPWVCLRLGVAGPQGSAPHDRVLGGQSGLAAGSGGPTAVLQRSRL